ncbi:hypothetical protein LCGC14_1372350 [marine sediment metagenome]|uniref:Uncharacterized protein n=1 Tax=marine sediment metagenome TaxID=412755 RepID=A0A0F9K539_9ZZZZ
MNVTDAVGILHKCAMGSKRYETIDDFRGALACRVGELTRPGAERWTERHLAAFYLKVIFDHNAAAAVEAVDAYWREHAWPHSPYSGPHTAAPLNRELADGEQRVTVTVESRDRPSVEHVHYGGKPDDTEGKGAWVANAAAEQRRPKPEWQEVEVGADGYARRNVGNVKVAVFSETQEATIEIPCVDGRTRVLRVSRMPHSELILEEHTGCPD